MKTVLITGATSGIGLAIVNKFNQEGFKLVLCGRRQERLEIIKKGLSVPCHTLCLDVRDYSNLTNVLQDLPEDFSSIDILINNAGLALGLEPAYEADLEDWNIMVDTNIKGLMGYTHAILPQMVKENKGHIINIGSIAGVNPYLGGNVYGGTKAFVHQFSANLRNDLLGSKIHVTVVSPGMVETEFFYNRFKGNKEREKKLFEGVKALDPADIAEIVFWVCQVPPHVNINMVEVMPICQAPGNTSPKRIA